MYCGLYSMGLCGIDAYEIQLEVHITPGVPGFNVVGLPSAEVRESRDRVRAAVQTCGYEFPNSRVTASLAPADVHKTGTLYDLPLMLAILSATGQIPPLPDDAVFIGELSLDGRLRAVDGALAIAAGAKELGRKSIFLPVANGPEAAVVEGINCYAAKDVPTLIAHLEGRHELAPVRPSHTDSPADLPYMPDFSEVRGQTEVKRAVEVAAAGGHNILLIGPPGSGKSMIAKRIPSILPCMSFDEAMQTTKIYSVAGKLSDHTRLLTERPFRSPHHNASVAAIAGGGNIPGPGEISLAHNGVLFLDEFPEFNAAAAEALRQPMEDGVVTISRASSRLTYPCEFQLVAAMNPCRCGYFGHPTRKCTCTPASAAKYLGKISGPLLDRIDIHVDVSPVTFEELSSTQRAESSAQIRARVERARQIQRERFVGSGITCNARIPSSRMMSDCPMTESAAKLMRVSFDTLNFSARAFNKVLKVARTIADLEGVEMITSAHISEAVQYRSLDRKYFSHDGSTNGMSK